MNRRAGGAPRLSHRVFERTSKNWLGELRNRSRIGTRFEQVVRPAVTSTLSGREPDSESSLFQTGTAREKTMSAFETATDFFHACETLKGWEGCKQYVAPGGRVFRSVEPLVDIDTVEGYANWMAALGSDALPGCSYDLHSSSYDASIRTAIFFATFSWDT